MSIPQELQHQINDLLIEDIPECYDDYIHYIMNSNIVASGGNADIYELDDHSLVKISTHFKPTRNNKSLEKKCKEGYGCENDILLEAIIMKQLNSLNLPNFVRFEKVCFSSEFGYLLQMKKVNNAVSFTNIHYKLSREQMLSILFQLTYALKMANEKNYFVHSDLIGQNIMIKVGKNEIIEYKDLRMRINNFGVTPVIIDFGYSRIQVGDNLRLVKITPSVIPDKFNPDELFSGWIDLCKIYANPNFRKKIEDLYGSTVIHGHPLRDIIKECNFKTQFYRVVPPFPKQQSPHYHLLMSELFNEIIDKSYS